MRKQAAVYWSPAYPGFDEYGRPAMGDPVEIMVRWESVQEEFIDSQGTRQISKAKVYVGHDIEIGGVLMLGTEDDLGSGLTAKENEGAFEVRAFEKNPDLRGTKFLRTVFL